jgi:mannose-6-phosphate isomerase-like protein (cupin superfamily)/GTP:adenosylcobinamide-phosphate guanylyltransferase
MIDKIVIVACGKGSRLNPYTNYIPKILVNINNENILKKIINYWKKYCKNFIILINSNFNSYINFYLNDYGQEINFEIRNVEILNDEENSYTIKNGLSDLDNLSILITWCDVFPEEEIDFNTVNDNCIFVNNFYNYKSRYLASNNTIVKIDNNFNLGNVIGIYYFKKFKKLINKHDKQDICDCYLDNYVNFITYELNQIIDIGDIEKLHSLINNNFISRYFNTITKINSNTIKKESNCEYGNKIIKDEINFYKYIENNNIDFPVEKIFDVSNNSFCMPFFEKNTLYEEILKTNTKSEIFHILKFLKNIYDKNKKKVTIEKIKEDIYLETIIKINDRNKNINLILKNFSFIEYVNFVKIDTYENILNKIQNKINFFLENNTNIDYNVIHGDLNLSNIFKIENNKYIFIDPRGYYGNSKIYGNKYYEISKIYLSLFGFDFLNQNNEYYFIINDNNIVTNINLLFENIEIYSELFTDSEYEFIICLAISVWLGVPYYFKDNILKMVGSYYYSLYLGTIYLDKIENLIKNKKIIKINKVLINEEIITVNNSVINTQIYNELIQREEKLKQEFESYKRLIVLKPWGYEFVCCEMDNLSLLVLHIKNGHSTSLHAHSNKDTPMLLAQGSLVIESLDKKYEVKPNQIIIINRQIFHKLCSYSDDTIVLEFEMKKPNKNDLIRYKDDYSRENLKYESKNNIIYLDKYYNDNIYDYFEYYNDSENTMKIFKNCEIYFINDKLENNINIEEHNIIVIIQGKLNIDGIYIDECSILFGRQVMNKNILYLTENFRYLIYKNKTEK